MILLVRHGEAAHHVQSLTGGWTDSELTPRGKWQMQRLANILSRDFQNQPKPKIYVSDLQRASLGGSMIARAVGAEKVIPCSFLREKNNGKAAGLSVEEAKAFYHPPLTGREIDHVNYDGGETRRTFYERTVAGFAPLLKEKAPLILVTHKGTIQNILFYWLNLSIDEVMQKRISFDIRPASLTMIGINKWGERSVFLLNETSYLSGDKEPTEFGLFHYPLAKGEENGTF
jgi:broad specificity phosphatase PhoE